MKRPSSCTRWQHLLKTILTEESLSSKEQADLHAHLVECSECTRLNEQRLTMLSTLRAQATTASLAQHPVQSANSRRNAYSLIQTVSKRKAPILLMRPKGGQKLRFLPVLKLIIVFFAWGVLWAILFTLIVSNSIPRPFPVAPLEQDTLIMKAINANAASLHWLNIGVCLGAGISFSLLLGKQLQMYVWRVLQTYSLTGKITILLDSEKGRGTPKTLYLEALDGKRIRRFTRVYASRTGQQWASFFLIRPGRYILYTSPSTRELTVSIRRGQRIIIEWDKKSEQPNTLQSVSHSEEYSEHWKHLTRDIKV